MITFWWLKYLLSYCKVILLVECDCDCTVEHRRKRRTVPQAIALSDLVSYRTVLVADQSDRPQR